MSKRDRTRRRRERQHRNRSGRREYVKPTEPQAELIQEPEDLKVLRMLQREEKWVVPIHVYDKLPAELFSAFRNEEWDPSYRLAAARILASMVNANAQRTRAQAQFTLHYNAAQPPSQPARDDIDADQVIDAPIAFSESLEGPEAEETYKILKQLEIETEILDVDAVDADMPPPVSNPFDAKR